MPWSPAFVPQGYVDDQVPSIEPGADADSKMKMGAKDARGWPSEDRRDQQSPTKKSPKGGKVLTGIMRE